MKAQTLMVSVGTFVLSVSAASAQSITITKAVKVDKGNNQTAYSIVGNANNVGNNYTVLIEIKDNMGAVIATKQVTVRNGAGVWGANIQAASGGVTACARLTDDPGVAGVQPCDAELAITDRTNDSNAGGCCTAGSTNGGFPQAQCLDGLLEAECIALMNDARFFLGGGVLCGDAPCVPAIGTWGLVALVMLVVAGGTVVLRRGLAVK